MKIHAISAAAACILSASLVQASGPPSPCPKDPDALCGTLRVPENRAVVGGRVLELDYVVIPARREELAPPLFFILGGPGESATSIAPFVLQSPLADVLDTRNLVLLDQRGTGGTHRLQCPQPDEPERQFGCLFDPEDVKACHDELAKLADLRLYTTSIAVEDLDALRLQLGYDEIALWGGSYGTRVAMEYIRRHGEHVERAILDALSGLDGRMPLFFAFDAQKAFDQVVADCTAEPACASSFPHLVNDLAATLDRLRGGPLQIKIRAGNPKRVVEVPFSLGDLGYTIRGMLYKPDETSRLPALLHLAAEEGNLTPFAQAYYRRANSLGDALANGMYLSVICAEDVPFITDDEAERWSAGTFLGEYLIHEYRQACALWDRGEIPDDYHEPVRSDRPVLIISGGRDPSTPPRWGEAAVRGLPNGRHIIFPYEGHGVGDTPCGATLIRRFLDGAHPDQLDPSCALDEESRIPFKIGVSSGS